MESVVSVAVTTLFPDVVERINPIICPLLLVTPVGCVIVSKTPREELRLTAFPGTGLLLISRKIIVMVEVAVPSATILVGEAVTVEFAADTPPAVKVMVVLPVADPKTDVAFTFAVPETIPARTPNVITPPLVNTWTPGIPASASTVEIVPRVVLTVIRVPSDTVFPFASVITELVTTEILAPSATIEPGFAVKVNVPDGTPGVKVTVAVSVTLIVPFTTALIVDVPTIVDRTVPVICPLAFVVPEGCTIVSVAPRLDDKVTDAPGTGLLFASRTVTVIVEIVPSATTLAGEASTIEVEALTGPAVNVIDAVWVIATPPATALITATPEVVDRTVPLICPDELVVPTG